MRRIEYGYDRKGTGVKRLTTESQEVLYFSLWVARFLKRCEKVLDIPLEVC